VTTIHPGPALTETIDALAGRVRVGGHLTPQGVDLLRGTVANLHRLGHRHVVLDLAGVHTVDDGALDLLRTLPDGDQQTGTVVLVNAR
jgi:anti-anti-sigma regulatory factor